MRPTRLRFLPSGADASLCSTGSLATLTPALHVPVEHVSCVLHVLQEPIDESPIDHRPQHDTKNEARDQDEGIGTQLLIQPPTGERAAECGHEQDDPDLGEEGEVSDCLPVTFLDARLGRGRVYQPRSDALVTRSP